MITNSKGATGPAVAFRDVVKVYHPDIKALDHMSFDIQPGETVALLGPNGAGKSTAIDTMLGLRAPSSGDVLIGGVSVNQVGIGALRRMVGTVMQDDALFAGSIADNISFFDPRGDQAWIQECAGRASIHDEIVAMPMGYDTLIGDMGTALSGGQKQRVLLARALYRRPRILFLDEATSHLDVAREATVNCAIRDLHMTRVIVAHRPETIASADRVLELVDGRVNCSWRFPGPRATRRLRAAPAPSSSPGATCG